MFLYATVLTIFIIVQSFGSGSASKNDAILRRFRRHADKPYRITFKMPDLNVIYPIDGVNVTLQGYRVVSNENRREWVSIGHPMLVKNEDDTLYAFSPEAITLKLKILTREQEGALLDAARLLYPDAEDPLISLIVLQSVTCRTSFTIEDQLYSYQGQAINTDQYELEIEIPCQENSIERRVFEARAKNDEPLLWKCVFKANGRLNPHRIVEVSGNDLTEAAIKHNLFGEGDAVYVTRNQLDHFAQGIRHELQIVEDSEFRGTFEENLVEKFLKLNTGPFVNVNIDDALKKLSTCGLSMDKADLAPDVIKTKLSHDIEDILAYDKNENAQANDNAQSEERSSSKSKGGGASMTVKHINFGGSLGFAKQNRDAWHRAGKSTQEMVDEVNKNQNGELEFEVVGTRIVPKSLKVVLVTKDMLRNSKKIASKETKLEDAKYRKEFLLVDRRRFVEDKTVIELENEMDVAIGSVPRDLNQVYRMQFGHYAKGVLKHGGSDADHCHVVQATSIGCGSSYVLKHVDYLYEPSSRVYRMFCCQLEF